VHASRSIPLGLFAVALVIGSLLQFRSPSEPSLKAATLKPDKDRRNAPDFVLKDADGRTVRLSDYRGKVVLLDFWATWCDPCRYEIPWFMDMERKQKDKGFAVLGVSMDDDGWEVVKPFIARLGVNYRILVGNDETAQLYGGIDALPTTFLIDREGKIAFVHVGLGNRRDFEDGVEQLLQAPATAVTGRAAMPALLVGAK
jgi:cytochrome c biogenesis protein CcmG/thiol:disulfide interchange protein DsbE